MPPKGERICLDSWHCTHGESGAKKCPACREVIGRRISRDEAYLCLDCRGWSTKAGVLWPKKGSTTIVRKSPIIDTKKAKEIEKLSIDNTCLIHREKFKPGKDCVDCKDEFSSVVRNCKSCDGYDPNNMGFFCKQHKAWWEKQKLNWQCDPKMIDLAKPYPWGKTDEFLKGLEGICMAPRKK